MSLPLSVIRTKEKTSNDIWAKSIIDRYIVRPHSEMFEKMSLAHFVANYDIVSKTYPDKEIDSSDTEDEDSSNEQLIFPLSDDSGYIKKRRKAAVIRKPHFSLEDEPDKHYYNLIRLYVPHRITDLQFPGFASLSDFYAHGKIDNESVPDIIHEEQSQFENNVDSAYAAWEEVNSNRVDTEGWSAIAPNIEEQRLTDINLAVEQPVHQDPQEENPIPDLAPLDDVRHISGSHDTANMSVENIQPTISEQQLQTILRSLNKKQTALYYYIRDWCIKKSLHEDVDPFYIHLTGGAGNNNV